MGYIIGGCEKEISTKERRKYKRRKCMRSYQVRNYTDHNMITFSIPFFPLSFTIEVIVEHIMIFLERISSCKHSGSLGERTLVRRPVVLVEGKNFNATVHFDVF